MIIYGYRRFFRQLAMPMLVCQSCGNPAAHALRKLVTWFTLFFIPLFPCAPARYFTECTFCGMQNRLSRQQAVQLKAQDEQMRQQPQYPAAYPAQQQQPYPQRNQFPQQGQFPQQQYGHQQPYSGGIPAPQQPYSGGFPAQQNPYPPR